MPSLSSLAFALALAGAGYLNAICVTPPNPPPSQSRAYKGDRIHFLTGRVTRSVGYISLVLYLFHALLAVSWPSPAHDDAAAAASLQHICPHASNLHHDFYTWNSFTTTTLALTYLGAAIRLSAYGGLGKNFTFQLAPPDRLVTSGIYHFIQHPSYTGQFLISIAMNLLVLRWDSSPACFIPESSLAALTGWGWVVLIAPMAFASSALATRVKDEEGMLKEKFGQEWVRWHERTARFIPYVI
ncbi:hypothetical protein DTO271D3_5909 [Paecilomyces variotii]|nr:hypothetical protein DTO169E5_5458 [Paecilomyces variotii]KAJ9313815.1 hypothetical protein DTO271D3_5909 [Paecilomyces variotii]